MNLVKRESVLVTVGGTLITDIASMVILAVCISIHEVGFTWKFLVTELIELAVYVPLVIFGISKLARKAVIKFGQSAESRLSILIIVITLSSELAQFINLEGIVGAFLAGIAVKRSLKGKFTIEHPEVISQSLFIPAFF